MNRLGKALAVTVGCTGIVAEWGVCGYLLWDAAEARGDMGTAQTLCVVALLCLAPVVGGMMLALRKQLRIRSAYVNVLLAAWHAVTAVGAVALLVESYTVAGALAVTMVLFIPEVLTMVLCHLLAGGAERSARPAA